MRSFGNEYAERITPTNAVVGWNATRKGKPMCDETHLVGAVGVIRPCDGTIVSEHTVQLG